MNHCWQAWSDRDFVACYPPGSFAIAFRSADRDPVEVKILTAASGGVVFVEAVETGERHKVFTGRFIAKQSETISAEISATPQPSKESDPMATATAKRTTKKQDGNSKTTAAGNTRRIDTAHAAAGELTSSCVSPSQITVAENDRQTFEQTEIDALAASIKRHGMLQPLVVRCDVITGDYVLIAGERRLRAAKQLKLDSVPIRITTSKDEAANAEARLEENIRRVDLNPIEKAIAIQGLIEKGRTQKQVGELIGCTQAQVSNQLRLLQLPDPWRQLVIDGRLAPTSARELVPYCSPERQTVLNQLAMKLTPEISHGDGGAIEIDPWDLQDAVRKASRPTTLSHAYKPSPSECYFSYDEKQHAKLLEVDKVGRAWNIEAWEELNREPFAAAKAKHKKQTAVSRTSGSSKKTSGPDRWEIRNAISPSLSKHVATLLTKQHKSKLPGILMWMLHAECYDAAFTFLPTVGGQSKRNGKRADVLAAIKAIASDPAKVFAGVIKYLQNSEHAQLDESIGIAAIIDVDLTATWIPPREYFALFEDKDLRSEAAKVLKIAEAEQPQSREDLIDVLESEWPEGVVPKPIETTLAEAMK